MSEKIKKKLGLIADSSCDIPITTIGNYDIAIISVNVIFEDEIRIPYVNLTTEQIFEKIVAENAVPTTGLPPPKRFKEVFDKVLEKYEEAIFLTASKDLSGLWENAVKYAEEMTNGKVTVVDTRNSIHPFGLIVLKVARMIENGLSKEEILINVTNDLIPNARFEAFLGTLEFLKRSGRIATLQHLMGELFQFKPSITIRDGVVASNGKVRGENAKMKYLRTLGEKIANFLPENETIAIMHSSNMEKAIELKDYLHKVSNKDLEIVIWETGPASSVHLGPGLLGLAWIGPKGGDL
ncbi:MAG TPA: DegV family protein [candidate division Zixibacteria bacterium]|nr:DegV family protein [candidate division Zixibacteria bacterium]